LKLPCRLLPLMVVVSVCLFAGVFAYSEMLIGNGINFKTGSGGPIMFDVDITASRIYFENNYLIILNMNNRFNKIGFSCETATANMTVTKIASDEIDYTVNAPTDVTSTTKIYVGSKGRPSNVSGATSWSYNSNFKIITVNVLHQSPADIGLEWSYDASQERIDAFTGSIYQALGRIGSILTIMSISLLIGVLTGKFEFEGAIEFVVTCVIVTILFQVFVSVL